MCSRPSLRRSHTTVHPGPGEDSQHTPPPAQGQSHVPGLLQGAGLTSPWVHHLPPPGGGLHECWGGVWGGEGTGTVGGGGTINIVPLMLR